MLHIVLRYLEWNVTSGGHNNRCNISACYIASAVWARNKRQTSAVWPRYNRQISTGLLAQVPWSGALQPTFHSRTQIPCVCKLLFGVRLFLSTFYLIIKVAVIETIQRLELRLHHVTHYFRDTLFLLKVKRDYLAPRPGPFFISSPQELERTAR